MTNTILDVSFAMQHVFMGPFDHSQALEKQKKEHQKDIEYGSMTSLNSTVGKFVENRIQNVQLKSIAKELVVKQSQGLDRKSINLKLCQSLCRPEEVKRSAKTSCSGKSLVANYESDSDDSD